jgi:hypothetical protein
MNTVIRFSKIIFHLLEEAFSVLYRIAVKGTFGAIWFMPGRSGPWVERLYQKTQL